MKGRCTGGLRSPRHGGDSKQGHHTAMDHMRGTSSETVEKLNTLGGAPRHADGVKGVKPPREEMWFATSEHSNNAKKVHRGNVTYPATPMRGPSR
jgi:hypothetical protein